MNSKLYLIIIFLSLVFYQCSKNEIIIPYNCVTQEELGVTESDSIFSYRFFQNLKWKGSYSNEKVRIKFNYLYGTHGGQNDYVFEFNKVNNCLEVDKAYRVESHGLDQPKQIRGIRNIIIDSIKIQDWNENRLLSGKISFSIINNPSTTNSYSKNFWVEMDNLDYHEETSTPLFTLDCITDNFPKELDIDNDGVNDFVFDYMKIVRDNLSIPLNQYFTVINPLTPNNFVLKPSSSLLPYPSIGVFSSFNSINSYIVTEEGQRSFAFFNEYPLNYIEYNNWVTIVSADEIYHDIDNQFYILIKMTKNGLDYYGWINIKISIENCNFEIVNFYLNPIANEHVITP